MQTQSYNFQSLLGEGGMAKVYLAEHKTLGHEVAIKVLNREYVHNENIRKRFLAEARNLAKMNHPHVVRVMDLIEEGETVAFVMEYIDGQTLKSYLDEKGKLPDAEINWLFDQMLEGVGYVHEQGLVHRDIKPSNFMLDSRGNIKLLDFGIAKTLDASSAEYTQTATSQNMGTPMYMSPEQVKSTKDVTAESDIYSLGVVLWQMAAGRKPYDTNTLSKFEIQTKIVNEALPETGTIWDEVIKKGTSKAPSSRKLNDYSFEKLNLVNENQQVSDKIQEVSQVEGKVNQGLSPKIKLIDNVKRAKLVVRYLWILFGLILLSNFSILAQFGLLGKELRMEISNYEDLEGLFILIKFVLLILCAVAFIRWQMRACNNLKQVLPVSKFKYDAYDAWTWWFVPIWALWMPFRVIKSLFLGLVGVLQKTNYSIGFLRWWWFFWILGIIIQRFSYPTITGLLVNIKSDHESQVGITHLPVDEIILPFLAQWLDLVAIPLTILVVKTVENMGNQLLHKYQSQLRPI